MWFYFGVFCRTCVSDFFIVSEDFKEEWNVFCHTFRTNAFYVSLFLLVEFVRAIYVIVKQEFDRICTLFFDAFCRPNIQAVWQAFGACCVVTSFLISKEKTSIWSKRFCSWKSILWVKEHRRCVFGQFICYQDFEFLHLSHCWLFCLVLSHEAFQSTSLVKCES